MTLSRNRLAACGDGMVTPDVSQIDTGGGKRHRTCTPLPLLLHSGVYSSSTLHTKDWLDELERLPPHFYRDPELMEMLSQCDPSPVHVMSHIVKEVLGQPCDGLGGLDCGFSHGRSTSSSILDIVGGPSTSLHDTSSSQKMEELQDAKRIACTLYGFVVKRIIRKETSRLGMSNHGQLAANESLHRAILAICLDIIVEAKCLERFCYPWAENHTRTCPFDLLRVIESFLSAMDRELPIALKEHLRSIDIMILESHAWKITTKPDGGLLNIIETHIMEGGQWGKDMTATRADLVDIDANASIDKAVGRAKKAEATRRLHSVASDRAASLSLIFFHLSTLAAERVSQLCRVQLQMEEDLVSQVWTVAYQALGSKPMLLRNRHLDNILLCSVYSICKVQKDTSKRMKFSKILTAYHNMCNDMPIAACCGHHQQLMNKCAVTNDIELDEPRKRGGIIDFYNLVFIPEMKDFVLDFQSLEKQMAEVSTIKTVSDVQHMWKSVSSDDDVKEKGLTTTSTTAAKLRRSRPLKPSNLYLQPLGTTTNGRRTLHIVQQLPFQWCYDDVKRYYKSGVYVSTIAYTVEEVGMVV